MSLNTRGSLFLKGMAMGVADLIPGVSGGTIALIAGIYEELLGSLERIGPQSVKILCKNGWHVFWKHINGSFLLPILLGILLSVACFAKIIYFLLNTAPIPLWSFFFGLIVISFFSLLRKNFKLNAGYLIMIISGTACTWFITGATPVTADNPGLFIFFGAGMLAVCAMILPGISGSFILLLLGLYAPLLEAVLSVQLSVISVFFCGCVCGLLCFSRLLNWLLSSFSNLMMGFLSGLILGSLHKIWPWKYVPESATRNMEVSHHIIPCNITPWHYADLVGDAQSISALICMLTGILFILFLEKKFKKARKDI